MNRLNEWLKLEEYIEAYYIHLGELERNGKKDSLEYEEYFKLLWDAIEKEKTLILSLDQEDKEKLYMLAKEQSKNVGNSLCLGYLTNVSYKRVLEKLNDIIGDDLFVYANTLRYDLNQIIFSFLEYLINNDYYSAVKNDLIMYKYGLIFTNYRSEDDFLNGVDLELSLESNSFKTPELLSTVFVDKAILILEGREFLDNLTSLDNGFKCNINEYVLAIIAAVEVLARLILCDEELLPLLNDEFMVLNDNDEVCRDVKELMQDMFMILEGIKDKVKWSR